VNLTVMALAGWAALAVQQAILVAGVNASPRLINRLRRSGPHHGK
jgi:hypothetical protein